MPIVSTRVHVPLLLRRILEGIGLGDWQSVQVGSKSDTSSSVLPVQGGYNACVSKASPDVQPGYLSQSFNNPRTGPGFLVPEFRMAMKLVAKLDQLGRYLGNGSGKIKHGRFQSGIRAPLSRRVQPARTSARAKARGSLTFETFVMEFYQSTPTTANEYVVLRS
jgi:hypothetical protein